MSQRVRETTRSQKPPPASREPLSDAAIEAVADWLRIIAEPTRIRLMEILNAGSSNVQGLAAQLRTSRPNTSRHLAVLHQAGVVRRRKVGRNTLYELADWSGCWLIEQVGASVIAGQEASEPTIGN